MGTDMETDARWEMTLAIATLASTLLTDAILQVLAALQAALPAVAAVEEAEQAWHSSATWIGNAQNGQNASMGSRQEAAIL